MALDIDISHYNTGTATVAADGTEVTGQGTTWTVLRKGDLFGTHIGMPMRIDAINSDTSLTLAYPWKGPEQTAAPYEIQRTPFDIGYLAGIEELLRRWGGGNVDAFAELVLGARKLLATDASGQLGQADLAAWAQSMLGLEGAAKKIARTTSANETQLIDFSDAMAELANDPDFTTMRETMQLSRLAVTGVSVRTLDGERPRYVYGVTDLPEGEFEGWITVYDAGLAGYKSLEFISTTSSARWTVSQVAGSWGPWRSTRDASSLTQGLLDPARVGADLTADKAFRRGNVLGPVAQAAGVPTGALIESGSNASGIYERSASGWQKCIQRVDIYLDSSSFQTFPLPATFVGDVAASISFATAPYVGTNESWWQNVGKIGVYAGVSSSLVLFREALVPTAGYAYITTEGRWF